jgi:hypothetical protein
VLTTVTFTDTSGRTTVSILVQHRNQEDRDAHINSGMEAGLQDALDRSHQAESIQEVAACRPIGLVASPSPAR